MSQKHIQTDPELLKNAKKLRRTMTRHEKRLWYDFLQKYPIKVYKQRVIDNYIVDFYCYPARLVIELDGGQHYTDEGRAYDCSRTEVLERYGLSVLRFTNRDIDEKFNAVCCMIDSEIKKRMCAYRQ